MAAIKNTKYIARVTTVTGQKDRSSYLRSKLIMEIIGKYAASNFVVRQGILLDLAKKCFKRSYKILSLYTFWDKCERIPKVEYVLMFKTLYAKCEPCEIEDFQNTATVQLSLVYNRNRRLIVHESKNMAEIKELASTLANQFGTKIRDSATDRRNPRWLHSNLTNWKS